MPPVPCAVSRIYTEQGSTSETVTSRKRDRSSQGRPPSIRPACRPSVSDPVGNHCFFARRSRHRDTPDAGKYAAVCPQKQQCDRERRLCTPTAIGHNAKPVRLDNSKRVRCRAYLQRSPLPEHSSADRVASCAVRPKLTRKNGKCAATKISQLALDDASSASSTDR